MVGHITVETVEEHEDGSATVVFECDDDAKKQLINEGLVSLLKKAVGMEEGDGLDSVQPTEESSGADGVEKDQ
jgi:ribosome biogenesis SPOUT family RNA methylase Rps3